MKVFFYSVLLMISMLFVATCGTGSEQEELPIMGRFEVQGSDTIYHSIPDFAFINQDSLTITNETFTDKMYVADFFFTSCPTICPKVKKQMLRIYKKFEDEPRLHLLSHTIDPKRDTVGKLKKYAAGLEVASNKWHFVTGDKDELYAIADDYYSIVLEDESVPGGFDHSGYVILVDENRHIRSIVNGTEEESVDRIIQDIETLLAE